MARGGDGIGGIVKWGLILGGGYLGYRWWTGQSVIPAIGGSAAQQLLPPSLPPSTLPASTAPAPAAPSAAAVSTLNALYAAMVVAATAANFTSGNYDEWGFYFQKAAGYPAPDPTQAFPGSDRTSNWPSVTAAQYWAGIAPLVASQHGLSGIAARMAGLGALVGAYGR